MATITFVSFRFGGSDGVSIEAAKWMAALAALGHTIRSVAGEGTADLLLPGLAIAAPIPPSLDELSHALDGADLVIVENLCSLPLNPGAAAQVQLALADRSALFHHHDLPWQRSHLAHLPGPTDAPGWRHVTINEISRRELAVRGIDAEVLRNRFDLHPPVGNRAVTRGVLGIGNEPLLLFPSRAIARKNVGAALKLAHHLTATLWILGPAEDGYESTLAALVEQSPATVVRGSPAGITIHDAYAACDMVVVPSTWEGFGNPVLESVTHRRPLALHWYPVAAEIANYGFRFTAIDDVASLRATLVSPSMDDLDHNWRVAERSFNLQDLPDRLGSYLARQFPQFDE